MTCMVVYLNEVPVPEYNYGDLYVATYNYNMKFKMLEMYMYDHVVGC